MSYFIFFIFLSFPIFCDTCLRTPTVESGPTIPTSPMNPNPCDNSFTAGPDVSTVAVTVDASGVYMIEVTCPAGSYLFLFINNSDFVSFPQTFACDAASGKYTFLPGSGVPTPINILDCS